MRGPFTGALFIVVALTSGVAAAEVVPTCAEIACKEAPPSNREVQPGVSVSACGNLPGLKECQPAVVSVYATPAPAFQAQLDRIETMLKEMKR